MRTLPFMTTNPDQPQSRLLKKKKQNSERKNRVVVSAKNILTKCLGTIFDQDHKQKNTATP